ncbi:MAG: hypothetical protein LH603_11850 [Pseudonocardia sp.]|nr:hypothetical protein [Pseudonocardia sp.]
MLFHARDGKVRWRLQSQDGDVDVQVRGTIAADDLSFVRRATVAGAGIALLPELVGVRAVRDGRLEAVLPAHHVTGMPLYLVYPSPLHVPHRVPALRDFLLEHFPQ